MKEKLKYIIAAVLLTCVLTSSVFLNDFMAYAATDYSELPQIYWDANKLVGEGKLEEALAVYDSMISQYPDIIEGYLGKANCLYGMRKYEEAIPIYDKVIELDPLEMRGYFEQAQCFYFLNKFNESIEISDKAIVALPDRYEGYMSKAQALMRIDKTDEAIASYKKAIELCPKESTDIMMMYNSLGVFYSISGQYLDAIVAFQSCADYIKEYCFDMNREFFYSSLLNVANTYNDLKNYEMALAKYDELLSYSSKEPNALMGKAMIYYKQGTYSDAITYASLAIEIKPDENNYYLNRALMYEEAKDFKNMINDINKSLSFNSAGVSGIHLLLANGYKELGMYQEAMAACDLAAKQATSPLDVIFFTGCQISMKFEKYDVALKYINSAIDENPNEKAYVDYKKEVESKLNNSTFIFAPTASIKFVISKFADVWTYMASIMHAYPMAVIVAFLLLSL